MSCIDYTLKESDCKNNVFNNNNQSDRLYPSNSRLTRFRLVKRHSSSIKATKTSLRPGALCTGGEGVDVKHNSYDMYLARKKYPLKILDKQRQQVENELSTPLCTYCNQKY